MKKILVIVLSLVLAFSLAACGGGSDEEGASGEVIKLTIGAGHSETAMPYVQAANEFFIPEVTKRVEEETDYTIEFTTAWSGSVAKLPEISDAVKNGILDVGCALLPLQSSTYVPHAIDFYIPFNTGDAVILQDAKSQLYEEFPEVFTDVFDEQNQKYLGVGCAGNYQLLTTFEVDSFDDINGKQIACASTNSAWLEGTGAVPVQSDLTEAYQSFQTGLYEGWIMYPSSAYGYKLHEVAPYMCELNYGASSMGALTVNMDTWNSLPPEVQTIFEEVGAEYSVKSGEISNETDETGLQGMLDEGLTLTTMSAKDIEEYTNSLENLPLQYAEIVNDLGYDGYAVMTRFIEILAELGHEQPRDWTSEFPQ